VLQRRSHIFALPACPGLRTGVQFAANIVGSSVAGMQGQRSSSANKDASAELEMTVNMLIQIDKLVQLIESPVFTCASAPFIE